MLHYHHSYISNLSKNYSNYQKIIIRKMLNICKYHILLLLLLIPKVCSMQYVESEGR